jgi:uncharacterized protein YdeI (YjbR/CyaY-like superfamily)
MPTYTYDNRNLLGMGAFKKHVGLWFFQGVLINDHHNILTNAQECKTKAMRQIRIEKLDDIDEKIILEYISQSIANHKKGRVIKVIRKTGGITIPEELLTIFEKNSKLDFFLRGSQMEEKENILIISQVPKEIAPN